MALLALKSTRGMILPQSFSRSFFCITFTRDFGNDIEGTTNNPLVIERRCEKEPGDFRRQSVNLGGENPSIFRTLNTAPLRVFRVVFASAFFLLRTS